MTPESFHRERDNAPRRLPVRVTPALVRLRLAAHSAVAVRSGERTLCVSWRPVPHRDVEVRAQRLCAPHLQVEDGFLARCL